MVRVDLFQKRIMKLLASALNDSNEVPSNQATLPARRRRKSCTIANFRERGRLADAGIFLLAVSYPVLCVFIGKVVIR